MTDSVYVFLTRQTPPFVGTSSKLLACNQILQCSSECVLRSSFHTHNAAQSSSIPATADCLLLASGNGIAYGECVAGEKKT